jgi:hypothetical protein
MSSQIIATQRLSEYVLAASNIHSEREQLFEAYFPMRAVSRKGKADDSFFYNFLPNIYFGTLPVTLTTYLRI